LAAGYSEKTQKSTARLLRIGAARGIMGRAMAQENPISFT